MWSMVKYYYEDGTFEKLNNYQVSDIIHKIRNKKSKRKLKGWRRNGCRVYYTLNKERNGMPLARILYSTFIGEIFPGFQVDHKDEDPSNDNLYNLQLLTPEENAAKTTARRKSERWLPDEIVEEIKTLRFKKWLSYNEISKELGLKTHKISDVLNGEINNPVEITPEEIEEEFWNKYNL